MYQMDMTGIEWKIFRSAVDLFSELSYASVSMQQIAFEAGIKTNMIYRHFPTKDKILETVFRFYGSYIKLISPSLDDLLKAVETEHPHDVLRMLMKSEYRPEDEAVVRRCFHIILSQMGHDSRAKSVINSIFVSSVEMNLSAVLEKMIHLQKILPMDTDMAAKSLIFLYGSLAYYASIKYTYVAEELQKIYAYNIDMLINMIEVNEAVIVTD